jgi:hypothetical protein
MPFTGGARLWATHGFGRGLRFTGGYVIRITYSYNSTASPATTLDQAINFKVNYDVKSTSNWQVVIGQEDFQKEMLFENNGSTSSIDVINSVELEFNYFPNTDAAQTYYGFAEIVIKKIEIEFQDFLGIDDGVPFEPPTPMCNIIIYKKYLIFPMVLFDGNDDFVGEVEGAGFHPQGSIATLTANPADGYEFVEWILSCNPGDFLSNDIVYNHTVPNKTEQIIYAIFKSSNPSPYVLEIETIGDGQVTGAGEHIPGTDVSIEATPDEGWEFVDFKWNVEGDDYLHETELNPNILNMPSANVFLTATFKKQKFKVNVTIIGNGIVNGDGQHEYDTLVILEATPDQMWIFQYFRNTDTDEMIYPDSNQHEFFMPAHDMNFEAFFFKGFPAKITGNSEMTLQEGYEATRTENFEITGTNRELTTVFENNTVSKLQWQGGNHSGYIEIAAGLKKGTYKATISVSNEFNYNPYVFTFTLYVTPAPGKEPDTNYDDDNVLGTVEVRRGIVPIRIPQVLCGNQAYRHVPMIELHEKRATKDNRLFYAYELLGKNSGCLRLSRLAGNRRLEINYDRVIVLPRRVTSEINLPNNMLALIQAHLALALAIRFKTPQVEALKQKVAQCNLWFARQQSAIDRNTFIDVNAAYARFSSFGGLPFRRW